MHPIFEELNNETLHKIVEKEEECISILEEIQLIPEKKNVPACPECSGLMEAVDQEIAWLWICKNKECVGSVNPLENTFFEDIQLPLRDVMYLIIMYFVLKKDLEEAHKYYNFWRLMRGSPDISEETVNYVYEKCRRVCNIIMSQKYERMIGPYLPTLYLMYLHYNLNRPSVSWGRKAYDFLMDVKTVYPGRGKTGLNFKHLSASSSTVGHA